MMDSVVEAFFIYIMKRSLSHCCGVGEAFAMWFQAAWGGSVLFSKQHRHLMKGVERYCIACHNESNSFSVYKSIWNSENIFNVCVCAPVCLPAEQIQWPGTHIRCCWPACSVLPYCYKIPRFLPSLKLMNHLFQKPKSREITWQSFLSLQGLLKRCHGASASYLFQQDKFYDINLDIGDKSLQCSRKVDCLKLWLMWKAVGSSGLEERVDKAFFNARYAAVAQRDTV